MFKTCTKGHSVYWVDCPECDVAKKAGSMSLGEAMTAKELLPEHVDAQFCSDWLKGQVKRLFAQLAASEVREQILACQNKAQAELNRSLMVQNARFREALGKLQKTASQCIYGSHGNAFLPGQMKAWRAADTEARELLEQSCDEESKK